MHLIKRTHIWMTIFHDSRRVFKNYLTALLKYAVYKRRHRIKLLELNAFSAHSKIRHCR
jgi:hypothetical protein